MKWKTQYDTAANHTTTEACVQWIFLHTIFYDFLYSSSETLALADSPRE